MAAQQKYAQFQDTEACFEVEDGTVCRMPSPQPGPLQCTSPLSPGSPNSKTGNKNGNARGTAAQPPQPAPHLDKDKFVSYMDEHAKDSSQHQCAAYCRKGLEAGGLDTSDRPQDAKDYGLFLIKHGASAVSQDNYKPQKGDIAVFQGNAAHSHGHVEVYDGKQWISDYKQNNFSPYQTNVPPSRVYRFPDN